MPGRGTRFIAALKPIDFDGSQVPGQPTTAAASAKLVVGRDAELEVMRSQLRSARHRSRAAVFVTGDAGVGKTTLVDCFLEHAHTQGVLNA